MGVTVTLFAWFLQFLHILICKKLNLLTFKVLCILALFSGLWTESVHNVGCLILSLCWVIILLLTLIGCLLGWCIWFRTVCSAAGFCSLCFSYITVSGVPDPQLTHVAAVYSSLTVSWCVYNMKYSCLMFGSFMLWRDGKLSLTITFPC